MGYLVISVRINERIMIGDDIEILISDIKSGKKRVDVAIKAPKEIGITKKGTHLEEQKSNELEYRNKP